MKTCFPNKENRVTMEKRLEMKNMLLYMIRHGESEANAGGYHSGQSCVHLTERGRRQAAATREIIKGISFDRLYVSDVLRTQETAEIIIRHFGYDRKPE